MLKDMCTLVAQKHLPGIGNLLCSVTINVYGSLYCTSTGTLMNVVC